MSAVGIPAINPAVERPTDEVWEIIGEETGAPTYRFLGHRGDDGVLDLVGQATIPSACTTIMYVDAR